MPQGRRALGGFLRGFVDLVFEHGGRYYLLDWKSNHLGDSATRYALARWRRCARTPIRCRRPYALALHRWLRRLRGYDYERHFGGALCQKPGRGAGGMA